MSKQYKKLESVNDYDHEKAEELAKVFTEIEELRKRLDYLQELIAENKELQPFLWRTQDGKFIALHKIQDEHLKNILGYLPTQGRKISKELKAEARSRGFDVPEEVKTLPSLNIIDVMPDEWWDNNN